LRVSDFGAPSELHFLSKARHGFAKQRCLVHSWTKHPAGTSSPSTMSRFCSKGLRRFLYSVAMTCFVAATLIVTYPRSLDERLVARKTSEKHSANSSTQSNDLARMESIGMFYDISDDEWIIRRNHARQLNQEYSDPQHTATNNVAPMFTCPSAPAIGNQQMKICNPQRVYKRADCLIYSAGPRNDKEFGEQLYSTYGRTCQIHVFDPNHGQNGRYSNDENIYHHAWELQSTNEPQEHNDTESMSLQQSMERLGHNNRRIDVLHCQGCDFVPEWLDESVDIRQILLQTLPLSDSPTTPDPILPILGQILDRGFVPFSKDSVEDESAVDWGFVRLRPSFLDRPTSSQASL
jgi:Methyltransferase domain